MSTLEQVAILLVMIVCSLAGVITKWALGQKKKSDEKRMAAESEKMAMEYRHELEKKTLGQLIDDSNHYFDERKPGGPKAD